VRQGRNLLLFGAAAMLAAALAPAGCEGGGETAHNQPDPPGGGMGGAGGQAGGGDGGLGSGGSVPCEGLECRVDNCDGHPEATRLTGMVYAPNGTLPLYNAVVYIPKYPELELEPITPGASCEQCPTTIENALRTALTDATGAFTIEGVPSGDDIPLVVQIGKWRRRVTIPHVDACSDNALADPELTRLPRSRDEGDLPQMAMVTGGCDALPCLMRKMGLADEEFTASDGAGRMHIYRGVGGAGVDGGNALTPQAALWDSVTSLLPYDLTLLSCECDEFNQNKSALQKEHMRDYLNAGGRLFATHFHYTWFKNGPTGFNTIADWVSPGSANPFTIDTSFPKGQALAQWLQTVSSISGELINLSEIHEDVGAVSPAAQRWIYSDTPGESVKYFTFNTPLGTPPEDQCGRAVFSDIHVSTGSPTHVPTGCDAAPLTDQEKALAFFLFDLASCIIPDDTPPTPPVPE
jgi:hypothetical protein